jgi:hypothetical protein
MNTSFTPSPQKLRRAADIQEKILNLQDQLHEILGSPTIAPAPPSEEPKKKREVSRAARAKMRKAQKARWAKIRALAKT